MSNYIRKWAKYLAKYSRNWKMVLMDERRMRGRQHREISPATISVAPISGLAGAGSNAAACAPTIALVDLTSPRPPRCAPHPVFTPISMLCYVCSYALCRCVPTLDSCTHRRQGCQAARSAPFHLHTPSAGTRHPRLLAVHRPACEAARVQVLMLGVKALILQRPDHREFECCM